MRYNAWWVMTGILASSFAISTPAALAQQGATENRNPSYAELRREHPGWVQVPGMLIRPDCVHEIPDGATIQSKADGAARVISGGAMIARWGACPEQGIRTRPINKIGPDISSIPATGNGWVEAFGWMGTDDVQSISARWFVPQDPGNTGTTIYMFDGVVTTDNNWILQPVLENFGDGNGWWIESYYVHDTSIVMHGSKRGVSLSDTILGSVTVISSGSGTEREVFIQDQNNGSKSYFDYTTTDLHFTFSVAAVLEAYSIDNCDQFPSNGSTEFTNVVASPSHGWTAYDPSYWGWTGPSCNFGQTTNGPNLVLSY